MPKNKPARQHHIPEMLLKHFAVNNSLYVYEKANNRIEPRSPRGVFWRRNQYTRYVDGGNWGDWSAEEKLGNIESQTTPIFDRIIEDVQYGNAPTLSKNEQSICARFYVYMVHRNPSRSSEMLREMGTDDIIYEGVCKALASVGAPIPTRRVFDTAPGFADITKKLFHNTRVGFSAGLAMQLDESIEDLVKRAGLSIGTACREDARFLIGDCGVTRDDGDENRRFGWLPIAPNVAIAFELVVGQISLKSMNVDEVNAVNLVTWKQSDVVVGRCKADLSEMMNRHTTDRS